MITLILKQATTIIFTTTATLYLTHKINKTVKTLKGDANAKN